MRLFFLFIVGFAIGCIEKKSCDFVIPAGYKLVRFGDGKYGISNGAEVLLDADARYGRHFTDSYGNNFMMSFAKFSDSCRAKGNLESYLKDLELNEIKP